MEFANFTGHNPHLDFRIFCLKSWVHYIIYATDQPLSGLTDKK